MWVIDRTFQWASNVRNVDVANTLNPRAANLVKDFPEPAALLVCSEVHTGNTLSEAIKYLNSLHIKHKTLSLVYAEGTAGTVVDYWLIRSDKAGILPWRDDPARNP
ncbi:hypothetical protein D6833_04045 [Candidatus Parcubacteria bacterium]|nr:MAG: hypothetical protein D6833_04045 [Candidatus Parcubacteria bacterium]